MGSVRCPKCGHIQEEHLRICADCGRPVDRAMRAAAKPTGAIQKSASQRLSAEELLEKSGELVFKDNAEEALVAGARQAPAHWVHCPPLEARPLTGEVKIGRGDEVELKLVHIEVSRHHATLKELPSGEVVLTDQKSANGTFVNDERVTTRVVRRGDRIKIGPFALSIRDGREAGEAAAAGDEDTLAAGESAAVGKELETTMVMGRFEALTLAKILLHIERERRTGTLKVFDGRGAQGEVSVGAGSPLAAVWGQLRDEPAVRAMLRLPLGGSFAFSVDVSPAPPSMKMSLSQLVNELPRERIEGRAPDPVAPPQSRETDRILGLLDDYSARPKPEPPRAPTAAQANGARSFSQKALEHARQGRFAEAIADFTRAIELDPNLTVAWYSRGLARERSRDVAGALADYTQAIAVDPWNVVLYMRRAITRGARADLDGTIEDCTLALRVDPRAAVAYATRSCARRGKGDFAGAVEDATRALQLDGRHAIAWLNRGLAREKLGDTRGAREDLESYLSLLPASALAGSVRSTIERLRG